MKILVTGANGFTGKHFVSYARSHGHSIHPLKSNLLDINALNDEVIAAAPDAVVHLAAISFVAHSDISAFYNINVIGTTHLLDALLTLPKLPSRILLASSANIYGNCETSPIKETAQPAPVNHYAMSKLAMEYMARTYMPKLPIFFTRPFNYIGPNQSEVFVIPKIISHFVRKASAIELGNIDVEREFNDIGFVCDAYLKLLLLSKIGETYNICSGHTVNLRSVIKLLSDITQHTPEININPAFVRANEIQQLFGDPSKLFDCIGPIKIPTLTDTIQSIIDNYQSGLTQ